MNLKPCPFCGGTAVMRCSVNYEYEIACKACGIEVNTHYEGIDEAENAWNRRAITEKVLNENERCDTCHYWFPLKVKTMNGFEESHCCIRTCTLKEGAYVLEVGGNGTCELYARRIEQEGE